MSETEPGVPTHPNRGPLPILNWIIAIILGIYTELFADALRQFAAGVRDSSFRLDLQAIFFIALGAAIDVVPIFLLTKASANLTSPRAERVLFVVSLLASAFFMPPLSLFADLALGR